MDKAGEEKRHGDSREVTTLHERERVVRGENASHQNGDQHFDREIKQPQRRQPHALHPLLDQFQRRGGFRGEDADSVGEGDQSHAEELGVIGFLHRNVGVFDDFVV